MQLLWRISLFLVIVCGLVYVISDESQTNYTKTVETLVGCIVEGNPSINNSGIGNMLKEGYGCFCHKTPKLGLDTEPKDNIDRICKVYHQCMDTILQFEACDQLKLDTIPSREYEHGTDKNCTFIYEEPNGHPCSRFDEKSCQGIACRMCDASKAKDLEEQILDAINRNEDEDDRSPSTLYKLVKNDPSKTSNVC